ncbi:MAG: hypothetical protein RI897_2154 [Verrucomicrobiota bacterium]
MIGEEVVLGSVELGAVVHAAFPGVEDGDEADVVGVADGLKPMMELFDFGVEVLEEFEVVGFGEDDAGGGGDEGWLRDAGVGASGAVV